MILAIDPMSGQASDRRRAPGIRRRRSRRRSSHSSIEGSCRPHMHDGPHNVAPMKRRSSGISCADQCGATSACSGQDRGLTPSSEPVGMAIIPPCSGLSSELRHSVSDRRSLKATAASHVATNRAACVQCLGMRRPTNGCYSVKGTGVQGFSAPRGVRSAYGSRHYESAPSEDPASAAKLPGTPGGSFFWSALR
jgi:hypothetical protein